MDRTQLRNAGLAGVYRAPDQTLREAARDQAAALDFAVVGADVSKQRSLLHVLKKLGEDLGFPPWYGVNLDALHDCLTDPEWPGAGPTRGYLIEILGLEDFCRKHPADFAAVLEVLRSAAEIRRQDGTPFWLLVDSSTADLPPLPGR